MKKKNEKMPDLPGKTKKPFYKRWWFIALVVFIFIGALANGGKKEEEKTAQTEPKTEQKEEVKTKTKEEEKEEEPEEETDAFGFTSSDYITFRAITDTVADQYLSDYKTPWGNDDWTFVKFDDDAVMVSTNYTLKDTSVKQPMYCIFTWNPEDETYKCHFYSVGDAVFYDDGYADEFFENLASMTE